MWLYIRNIQRNSPVIWEADKLKLVEAWWKFAQNGFKTIQLYQWLSWWTEIMIEVWIWYQISTGSNMWRQCWCIYIQQITIIKNGCNNQASQKNRTCQKKKKLNFSHSFLTRFSSQKPYEVLITGVGVIRIIKYESLGRNAELKKQSCADHYYTS